MSESAEPFAKLFDTPHGQLLAFLDENEEGEPIVHVIGAYCEGVRPSAKLSGWSEDETGCQKAFDSIDQQGADRFASDLRSAVTNLMARGEK